jgi:hypothetical protein
MTRALVIALLVIACKSADQPPVPPRTFGVAAEIRGLATLVPGTRRFAVRAGAGWYESPALVDQPAIGRAIARELDTLGGVVDVFFGTTPIVVGGEDHREQHVRIPTSAVALDGLATKIESLPDGREVWAYTHELTKHLAFVSGATVDSPPAFARLAPVGDSASPVSRRLCELPSVHDIAVSDRAAYALVIECNDDAPVRVARFEPTASETQLPSRRTLGATVDKLAISRTGQVALVGVRDGKLSIDRVTGTEVKVATFGAVSRVFAAVVAGDGAVWTFVLAGQPTVLRDGVVVALGEGHTPTGLAVDATLGVSVLALGNNATWLYAEHPPATPLVITPPS